MARPTIEEYRERLRGMTNRELVDKASGEILSAAIMNGSRFDDGWSADCADACMDEAARRGNPDLYQRAFNDAVRSQGHDGMVRDVSTPIDHGDPTLVASNEQQTQGEVS